MHKQFQVLAEIILTLLSNLSMPKGMLFILCDTFISSLAGTVPIPQIFNEFFI